MMFSYFPYAAAFSGEDGGIDLILVAISLAVAPFVFVAIGLLSRNPKSPKAVLRSMALLPLVGMSVGLIAPILGASAAFMVGGALTLDRPPVEGVMRWRWMAVAFTIFYLFVLLVAVTPAGVFAGGLVPLLMIGFADEYARWTAARA